MAELLRLGSFLGFLVLGFGVARAAGPARRRAIQRLLAYVLVLELVVGVCQVDDWPFTSHTIAVGRARADSRVCATELVGLDDAGLRAYSSCWLVAEGPGRPIARRLLLEHRR